MKSALVIGLISFIAGIACTLLGLALMALIGFQAEPSFIEYPTGDSSSMSAPIVDTQILVPTASNITLPTASNITPAQQDAIRHAYEAIDKADKAAEYRRSE